MENACCGQSTEESVTGLLRRIRAEYLEMPGQMLTIEQAARGWHLERHLCQTLLDALVENGFLTRTPAGRYVRAG